MEVDSDPIPLLLLSGGRIVENHVPLDDYYVKVDKCF